MASLNKIILIGNLGADPEVKFLPSGTAVANLRIATNEKWTNKATGAPEERTEWHRVSVFGPQAQNCQKYLSKGRQVYIEGRLQTRKWQDKDGQEKYSTEVVANNVLFLGGGSGGAGTGAGARDFGGDASSSDNSGPPSFNAEDDIPF